MLAIRLPRSINAEPAQELKDERKPKPEEVVMWRCPVCLEMHDWEEDAADCCAEDEGNDDLASIARACCPSCSTQYETYESAVDCCMWLTHSPAERWELARQLRAYGYLWSLRQSQPYRTMGCGAMFTYLTGFRAAEVRPFHLSGITDQGVRVLSAKRKMGEAEVVKLREWSPRLRAVVERAKQTAAAGSVVKSMYLFPNRRGNRTARAAGGRSGRTQCGIGSHRSIGTRPRRSSMRSSTLHAGANRIGCRRPMRARVTRSLTTRNTSPYRTSGRRRSRRSSKADRRTRTTSRRTRTRRRRTDITTGARSNGHRQPSK